jgi:hypothetical protein
VITAFLWLLSVALVLFGVLGLLGTNARADATTSAYVIGYTIIAIGLGFGVWARKRKRRKEAPLEKGNPTEVEDPTFTWDGDTDSPEALEAAFRSDEVPALPDGTIPGPVPPHIVGSLPLLSESLGGFLRSYTSNRAGLVRAFVMAAVFAGLAVVCVQLPHQKPPQPGEEILVFGMFYSIAGVCVLMGLGILWTTFASSDRTFHLFEDGVVEISGRKSRVISFAQIEQCSEVSEFKLLTLHHINMYWFELTDKNPRLEIDSDTTRNAAELGDFIQARVFDRLLPQTVEAINAGLKLSWGPATLDSQGISFGFRGTYRWDRIRGLGIARLGGSVVVNTGRFPKHTGVRADAIPNYPLLFRVSEMMCSGA